MTKRADRPRFLVRLNLNDPRHRRAWERLQKRGNTSYTEAVVSAIDQQVERELVDDFCDEVKQTVREAVKEAVSLYQPAAAAPAPMPDNEKAAQEDENYGTFMHFTHGLECTE